MFVVESIFTNQLGLYDMDKSCRTAYGEFCSDDGSGNGNGFRLCMRGGRKVTFHQHIQYEVVKLLNSDSLFHGVNKYLYICEIKAIAYE